jgi:hemolysin activation/secretion protein
MWLMVLILAAPGRVVRSQEAPPGSGGPAAAGASAADAGKLPSQQIHFRVDEYRVIGNSVLPQRDVEGVLYPLLGDDKQFSDVEAARAALEKLYHDRGFGTVFVDIPAQDVGEGIVRLHVTEGRLNARTVSGAKYFSERDVAAALPATAVGTVPNLPELQKELAAVNSATPDRSVVPVLKAGPLPGTMDLDLKVGDKLPLHGSFELNDDYTVDTKPLRAAVGLTYANLFGAFDSVSVQYQDAPQDLGQVSVLNVAYQSRPFADGMRVLGSFTNSNSNVAAVGGGAVGVLGKGQIYTVRLSYPLVISSESLQSLSLGFDYKHFRDTVTLGGGTDLVTPISYTNLSGSYAGSWVSKVADETANIGVNFGPRGFPNNADTFENKRFLGRPNYFYLRWDGSLNAHLPAGFTSQFRLAGQWANEPLISNENFSVGGSDGVRGYLEAEELGDTGVKGTVQLQTPTWSWSLPQLVNVFVYYDIGHTHVLDVLANQPDHADLRSWGGGLNLLPGHPISGVLTWSEPLRNGSYTLAHQSRVLFSVRGTF